MTDFDELLTADEVARILAIPVRTLYAWRSRGHDSTGRALGPDSFLVGASVRYRRSKVEEYLREQEAATSAHRRSA